MGKLLNAAISSYYASDMQDEDYEDDALTAMKAYESLVVEEVLREHADEVEKQERAIREDIRQKAQEQALQDSMRSFTGLIREAVVLALVVGLIGSHLYGISEAYCYAPFEDFNYFMSIVITVALVLICVVLLGYMFANSLPEWVKNAIRNSHERE